MDELPDLLLEAVGGETVVETVDLGGGDAVAVTPARTYLYRSEGLLSDESVESFGHDAERFALDPGRRKTSVRLQTIDDEESFTIPDSVVDVVVEAMLDGVLRTSGVVAPEETVEAQFRFSELTLVVTDRQLLKHVGSAVWDDEFEAVRYEDLTGLEFEEGSVATQVVLEVDGRQQRVKVPNDQAGRVRQEVQSSIFEFHGVSSLGGLREAVAEDEDEDDAETTDESGADAGAVGESSADAGGGADAGTAPGAAADAGGPDAEDDGFVSADWSPPADQDITRSEAADDADTGAGTGTGTGGSVPGVESTTDADDAVGAGGETTSGAGSTDDAADHPDVASLAEQVEVLSEQVEYQTELIETQQETIEQLVEELRRGR